MSNATAPDPPPTPATPPAAPPGPSVSTSATLQERMALKRGRITAKASAAPAAPAANDNDAGKGGGTAEATGPSATPTAPAGATGPANDNSGKGADQPTEEAKATPELTDIEKAKLARKAESEQRQKVVKEALSLRAEKRKLKAMRAELETKERDRQAFEAEKREIEELRRRDPIAAARRFGVSVKDFIEHDLKSEQAKPKVPLEDLPPEVRAELEASRKYREEQAAKEKEREEREAQAERDRRAADGNARAQAHLGAMWDEEAEDYPHLATYYDKATIVASAWHHMMAHFEETEETLDPRKVLSYMDDYVRKEREKFSKPLPAKAVPDRASREANQASNPEPTTMTQSDAASGAPVVRKGESMQQRKERIRRRAQTR